METISEMMEQRKNLILKMMEQRENSVMKRNLQDQKDAHHASQLEIKNLLQLQRKTEEDFNQPHPPMLMELEPVNSQKIAHHAKVNGVIRKTSQHSSLMLMKSLMLF